MNYRLLPPKEWETLEPIFKQNGSLLPAIGNIAVASNGNGIAGFQCLQPVLHIEPLWVNPEYSGLVRFSLLLDELKKTMPKGTEFYAFSPSDITNRICEHLTLSRLPWSVWKGKV